MPVPALVVPDEEAVLERILRHAAAKTTDHAARSHEEPIAHYVDAARLADERAKVLGVLPSIVAASAELAAPGAYVARVHLGTPLLVTRDADGTVRAFVNACRHRNGPVAPDGAGCAKAFVCPYHGWTYDRAGQLMHVPHEDGFALSPDRRALAAVPVVERHGLVWRERDPARRAADHAAPIAAGLDAFRIGEHALLQSTEHTIAANWKFVIETFLEGYHIRTLHKETFYPYGFDNLALHDVFGPHSRVVFPFRRVLSLAETAPGERRLRRCATVVFQVFPNAIVAAQPYSVLVAMLEPMDVATTRLRYTVLVHPDESREKTHADATFLARGLEEDMAIAAAMQARAAAMAGSSVLFGAFEGALAHFHAGIAAQLR
jgi:phenylpropionate dioxygenase-like ring-hydroxylating dioxygenase large terminal subunit